MTWPQPSTSVALPLSKRCRLGPTAMVSCLTAQETEAAALDLSVQWLDGDTSEQGDPPLPVPQPQGGNIPTEMAPLCVNIGDTNWVYHCQVEGCPEGPSSSHATICTHVHHIHLGTKLLCPLCPITFFNTDTLKWMASKHIALGF